MGTGRPQTKPTLLLYFAYGSNLLMAWLQRRVPSAVVVTGFDLPSDSN
jgi:hypothetical protein